VTRATIKEALLEVSRLWLHKAAAGEMSIETVDLYIQVSERFHRYADAHHISRMDDVTRDLTETFISAPAATAATTSPWSLGTAPAASAAPRSPPSSRTPEPWI
jgi:hypothetical protein